MGNVAILMRKSGYDVLGSDSGMYEPMKGALARAGVEACEGWDPKRIEEFSPDVVVVGNAVSRMNPELEFVLSRGYRYTSLPSLVGERLIGARPSLVVSGTHGKTTTTSAAAYLLRESGTDCGWLIGGVPLDFEDGGACLGTADAPFVIEGDEYDSAFFDKRSKFIHYRPRVLAINNIEFDHADIFRDLHDVKRAFTHVRRVVSPLGAIVENGDDENIASLEPTPWVRRLSVGFGRNCDVRISSFVQSGESSSFKIVCGGIEKTVEWGLSGEFNARNAAVAAVGAALLLGLSPLDLDISKFSGFRGVKRRQEILCSTPNAIVVEDFGHHPTAIAMTLKTMRQKYPDRKIIACFEPRSNTAKTKVLQADFEKALDLADAAYIGAVNAPKISAELRMDTASMAERNPKKIRAFSRNADLLEALVSDVLSASDTPHLCVFFSNGSFDGIHDKFASLCKGEPKA